jgi:PHP family Zn ribbon phosphoesterase
MRKFDKNGTLKQQIARMSNITRDGKYEYFAGAAGLYGQAFFGHKATKAQRAKLRYIWKQVFWYN